MGPEPGEPTGEGFDAQMNLLLVGLGGGALPMFINKYIPNISGYSCATVCVWLCVSCGWVYSKLQM